jgi:hypothetical protein
MWWWWWLACDGDPVASCEHFPESDCCSVSSECFDFYGDEFPFCRNPGGALGGSCSECLDDSHCLRGESCQVFDGETAGCFPES